MRLSLLSKVENAHEDSIWAAAWSPATHMLMTGSVDESVKMWAESAVGDSLEQRHHVVGGWAGWWAGGRVGWAAGRVGGPGA